MSKIILGKNDSGPVSIDLDLLLAGRALIQAGSGGGKSWLIRLMIEQIYGKVPIWVIDPEGEFNSLRESGKFAFFVVGKGGDVPADPRYARLLVEKLLELGANVIFDIFELKPEVRQHFVRALLEAMVDAPKALWQALILFMDEAHVFAPESGKAEAYGATVDMATRGRKRGFALVPATQRLAGLSKNVTTQLLNRLVGPTFEDVDLDRAADLLSVLKSERHRFFEEMRVLEPGNFHAVGRAFGKHRILFKVGKVETYHPEVGKSRFAAAPPPAPEKIKALLPKLADLPKEAEEKIKTEKELRTEVRSLKAQLEAKFKEQGLKVVQAPAPKPKHVPVLTAEQYKRLNATVDTAFHLYGRAEKFGQELREAGTALRESALAMRAAIDATAKASQPAAQPVVHAPAKVMPVQFMARKLRTDFQLPEGTPVPTGRVPMVQLPAEHGLTPAQYRILTALASFAALAIRDVPRTWLAARAGASHKSSAYGNNLGALRSKGFIEYSGGGVRLSEAGRNLVPQGVAPRTEDLLDDCTELVTPAQARILKAAHAGHPNAVPREDLAAAAGASPTSSAFGNNLGALRSAGMIEYTPGGVKASDWLFVD